MDTLVTTIIASAVAIVAAIIGTVASSRKHDQNLAVHSTKSESEHASIVKEISNAHEKTDLVIGATGKEVTEVRSTLLNLKDRIIESETEQRIRVSNLDEAQKKLCSSAEDIGKFSVEFSKLVSDNQRLLEENKNLIIERDDLLYRLEKNREIIRNFNQQANQNSESENDELEPG